MRTSGGWPPGPLVFWSCPCRPAAPPELSVVTEGARSRLRAGAVEVGGVGLVGLWVSPRVSAGRSTTRPPTPWLASCRMQCGRRLPGALAPRLSSSTWLPESATECTPSASIEVDPVIAAATNLATATPRFAPNAVPTARVPPSAAMISSLHEPLLLSSVSAERPSRCLPMHLRDAAHDIDAPHAALRQVSAQLLAGRSKVTRSRVVATWVSARPASRVVALGAWVSGGYPGDCRRWRRG